MLRGPLLLGAQFSRKQLWKIGAAAAILLLAFISIFHMLSGKGSSSGKASSPVSTFAPVDASTVAAPGQQPSAKTASPSQPVVSQPGASKTRQVQNSRLADQSKGKKDRLSAQEEPPKVAEVVQKPPVPSRSSKCDLEQNQLGGQVEQAEKSLARGRYKDALRQFSSVLACEPGNSRAQEGLTRVHLAQSAEGATSDN